MNFYEVLIETLKTIPEFVSEDNSLLKNQIIESAMRLDDSLIESLFNNELIRERLFKKIGDNYIFDKVEFSWLINNREFLPDSYTKFKNIIGLNWDNKYLINNNDVVLAFPFKDCVLEGGQSFEDQKRDEVFYNEIISKDQITNLLSPKVITNVVKYSKDGKTKDFEIKHDDNFLIKGNNLLVISSLLKNYEGQVDLIYIDPPFNTGKDSFKYNDRFTRSTWLTYMKNRLEVSKKLLSDHGSIFIHIDENQSHYLKVLCDEVFGEENFMNEIVWRYRTYIGNVKEYFPKKHDLIFWYKKKEKPFFKLSNVGNYEDTPDYARWKNYLNENGEIVYGNHPKTDSRFEAYLRKYFSQFGTPKEGDVIYQNKGYVVDDVWEDIIALDAKNGTERITEFSGSGQKPEALLERIIDSVTKEGDLVLDFFSGSGTTCAVAHKMNRRYIGVEQMDYVESITSKRLQNVISGEQGGISEHVNWQGGGSFVYCELLENSSKYIEKINKANDTEKLIKIWEELVKSPFVNFRIDIQQFKNNLDEFKNLDIEVQKEILLSIIDKNQMYINYCDIEDADYSVSDEDKKRNAEFYEGE